MLGVSEAAGVSATDESDRHRGHRRDMSIPGQQPIHTPILCLYAALQWTQEQEKADPGGHSCTPMSTEAWQIEGRSVGEVGEATKLHVLVWANAAAKLEEELEARPKGEDGRVDGVDAKDEQGNTPLMLAVKLEHVDCVAALLGAGASVRQRVRGRSWGSLSTALTRRSRPQARCRNGQFRRLCHNGAHNGRTATLCARADP